MVGSWDTSFDIPATDAFLLLDNFREKQYIHNHETSMKMWASMVPAYAFGGQEPPEPPSLELEDDEEEQDTFAGLTFLE